MTLHLILDVKIKGMNSIDTFLKFCPNIFLILIFKRVKNMKLRTNGSKWSDSKGYWTRKESYFENIKGKSFMSNMKF